MLNNNRVRHLSLRSLINTFFIRALTNRKVKLKNGVVVIGGMPVFKIPGHGEVVIGNNVILNSDRKWSNTAITTRVKFVTGINGKIVVGDNCDFNGICLVAYDKIEIGNFCQFASSTLISDTDFHSVNPEIRIKQLKGEYFSFDEVKKERIRLGHNVWVGWGSVILKGANIEDNCIVAAGSVVLKGTYPANSLIAGNPAKVVKTYRV